MFKYNIKSKYSYPKIKKQNNINIKKKPQNVKQDTDVIQKNIKKISNSTNKNKTAIQKKLKSNI